MFINANPSRLSPVPPSRQPYMINPSAAKINYPFPYHPRPSKCEDRLPYIPSLSISGKKESTANFFQAARARAKPKNSKSSRSISSSGASQAKSNLIVETKTKNSPETDNEHKLISEAYKDTFHSKHNKVLNKSKDLVNYAYKVREDQKVLNRISHQEDQQHL